MTNFVFIGIEYDLISSSIKIRFEIINIATVFHNLVLEFMVRDVYWSRVWIQEKLLRLNKDSQSAKNQTSAYSNLWQQCHNTERQKKDDRLKESLYNITITMCKNLKTLLLRIFHYCFSYNHVYCRCRLFFFSYFLPQVLTK